MLFNEVPQTLHGTETEIRGASTRWIPEWTGAQEVKTRQPAGPAWNRAGDHQQAPAVEEGLDQAIRQLGAGSLQEARKLGTAQKRDLAARLNPDYPVRLICRLLDLPRSSYYYPPRTPQDSSLFSAVQRLMQERPGYGYRRITSQLHQEGWKVSQKWVYLVMRRLRSLKQ